MHRHAPLHRYTPLQAIRLAPEVPSAHLQLGTCHRRSNDRLRATECFLKAVELSEEGTQAWAAAVADAFNELMQPSQLHLPKPSWYYIPLHDSPLHHTYACACSAWARETPSLATMEQA